MKIYETGKVGDNISKRAYYNNIETKSKHIFNTFLYERIVNYPFVERQINGAWPTMVS